ncbi:MAG: RraA family protein [Dehalococcoidia bacterium]
MILATEDSIKLLYSLDSATVFNAVVESMGGSQGGLELEDKGGVPLNYMGPEIRSIIPSLGKSVGYAVTAELTSNDPDSPSLQWEEHYTALENSPNPTIAIIKDVDSNPGRGACFGDGMAAKYSTLGVSGVIVEGSARDIAGITKVGMPLWATGSVPGHGVFNLISVNKSIVVGSLRIHPGELLIADLDGCTKIPLGLDPNKIANIAKEIQIRESEGIKKILES